MTLSRPRRPHPARAAARWRWLLPAAASLLAACAYSPAPDAGAAARRAGAMPGAVSVTHAVALQPGNARAAGADNEQARRAWLDVLSEYLAERAAAVLPAGQKLEVVITDAQRAGGDASPPRIDLTFRRLAAGGQVLQSGSRQLREVNGSMRPRRHGNDPLRQEKALVDDWVGQELGAAR